jgi:hypothetical protein
MMPASFCRGNVPYYSFVLRTPSGVCYKRLTRFRSALVGLSNAAVQARSNRHRPELNQQANFAGRHLPAIRITSAEQTAVRLRDSNKCVTMIALAAIIAAAHLPIQSANPIRSGSIGSVIAREARASKPPTSFAKSGSPSSISNARKCAKKTVSIQASEIPSLPYLLPTLLEARKHAVLELIRYPWEDLGFDIVFFNARTGYRGLTISAQRRIEIYVRSGEGPILQAFDLAHELGHAFDLKYNDEARRREWLALRGIQTSTPWFGCDACPDYGTPAGDFAETFAFLLLGPGDFHSTLSPQPGADQIPRLAAFCRIPRVSEALRASAPQGNAPPVVAESNVYSNYSPAAIPNED